MARAEGLAACVLYGAWRAGTERSSDLRRPASGAHTSDVTEPRSFAVCLACGAAIENWRERFMPLRRGELALTERGELAVRVRKPEACRACGHNLVEIRVEDSH